MDITKVREALKRLNNNLDRYMGYYDEKDNHIMDGGEIDTKLVNEALTDYERLLKKETNFKNMLTDKIKSNSELLEKGYWQRIAYENQILNNILKMLDWSEE